MSLTMLKQDAEILVEMARNYEEIIGKKDLPKEEHESQIKNFKKQFLYLLTAIHKIIEEEKNAR